MTAPVVSSLSTNSVEGETPTFQSLLKEPQAHQQLSDDGIIQTHGMTNATGATSIPGQYYHQHLLTNSLAADVTTNNNEDHHGVVKTLGLVGCATVNANSSSRSTTDTNTTASLQHQVFQQQTGGEGEFLSSSLIPEATSKVQQQPKLTKQQPSVDLRRQLCDQNLFVFHLPSQWSEEDMKREFSKFGNILNAKVVKRPDGSSKGYGFVCYTEGLSACRAMDSMNGRPFAGKRLKVSLKKTPEECLHLQVQKLMEISNANQPYDRDRDCTLFVFHLPSTWDDKEIYQHFQTFGTLLSAKIAKRPDGTSRGYGFVTYDNPRAAALAMANMNGVDVGSNKKLKVQLKQQINPPQPVPGCTIFIFHLPNDWTDNHLRQHFSHYGKIVSATVQRDSSGNSRGYGFISFDRQQSALNAVIGMNGFAIGHKRLKVSLKKGQYSEFSSLPQPYSQQNDINYWDATTAAAAVDFAAATVAAQAPLSPSNRVAAMAAALRGTTLQPQAYAATHPYTAAAAAAQIGGVPPMTSYPATPGATGYNYPTPPYSNYLPPLWGLPSNNNQQQQQQRLRR